MTEPPRVTIDATAASGVHAVEIWGADAIHRLAAQSGVTLPPPGRATHGDGWRAIRIEPAVWLLDGPALDPAAIAAALGDDGAITAIGGGLIRVRIAGPDWRALLMADGVFDAESAAFTPGCAASTIIAHVAVRLHVVDTETCEALVPASLAHDLVRSWSDTARRMALLGRP